MLTFPFDPSFYLLVSIQALGVFSAFIAHRTSGTGMQNLCQLISLCAMGVAGFAGVLGGATPVRCLLCGTVFAAMVLTATFDRSGFGLRPLATEE